jgi:hypothetical protein
LVARLRNLNLLSIYNLWAGVKVAKPKNAPARNLERFGVKPVIRAEERINSSILYKGFWNLLEVSLFFVRHNFE